MPDQTKTRNAEPTTKPSADLLSLAPLMIVMAVTYVWFFSQVLTYTG